MGTFKVKKSHKVVLAFVTMVFLVACAQFTQRKGWNKAYGPVVPHDTMPADCTLCHESGSWNKLKVNFSYDHEKETGIALRGAHNTTQCLLCHNDRGPVKQFADRGCRGCHEDVHRGKLGSQCSDCHNEDTWHPTSAIAKHNQTRFPLVGAHAAADCTRCHVGAAMGDFQLPSIACESCHAQDAASSTGLDHLGQGLTDRCDRCHKPVAWKPAGFDHPSNFPLAAGHANVSCNTCHTTPGTFEGLSTDCVSCHQPDFQRTTNPNHSSAGFSTNCTDCHSTSHWQGGAFQHTAAFPLLNGHAGQTCNACHSSGVYAGLPSSCVSCHQADFQRTTSPSHSAAGFSTACTQCHNTTRWQGADFQHTSTFALTQGHANRSCNACHQTPGTYSGLSTNCSSCHLDDFQRTTNPNHSTGGFGTDCTQCHTTLTWQGGNFQHTAAFPLTSGHAGRSCTQCHTTPGVYTGLTGAACSTCHMTNYQATTAPKHSEPAFATNCTQCHNTTQWTGATFPHPTTFALTHGHSNQACTACHTTPGVYTGRSTTCSSCHLDDFQRTTNPNHTTVGFGTDCTQCHTTTTWQGANFQHTAAFPLTSGHAGRSCTQCHTTPGVYTGLTGAACSTCHMTNYQATTAPRHSEPSFATNCTQCHTTTQWTGATFPHPTNFPLTNGHASRACTSCHTTPGVYTGLSQSCSSCHMPDYQRTTDPNHVSAGFPLNCTQCHNTTVWQGATFQHTAAFPLTNGHTGRSCTLCHTTPGVFTGLAGAACSVCHMPDYQGTLAPKHVVPAFPTNCSQCHNTTQWPGASFSHTSTFPLNNGHANQACATCHQTPGVYTGLSTTCSTCHMPDYQQAANHVTAGFPTSCTQCHNTSQWQGATFNHPASFPLNNGHAGRTCSACHTTPGVLTGLSTACSSCHMTNYQRTTSPKHTAPAFPTNCSQCHNTSLWTSATFPHTPTFGLTNGHANRACTECHQTPGVYTGLNTTCSSCHIVDYQRTTAPNHVTAGFPTNCTQCHNTSQWQGATFNHPASFPLNNGHAGRTCSTCHVIPNVFTGLSTACSSCHMTNYQRTTSPKHTAPAFSTNCSQCHNTSLWTGATFPHTPTFALTNGHSNRACTACHQTPGVYTGLLTTCSSCHMVDFQHTTAPNHVTAGFPTNCTQCHTTSQWQGATFNHPATFPLSNGHAGRTCSTCHVVPNVFTGLSTACASCHLTRYQQTTSPHHVAPAFSLICTQCHTTVQWPGAVFPHTPTFPLSNAHANRACSTCHTNPNVYTGLSRDCVSCHLADYQRTTNPNHAQLGYPTSCTTCHTPTLWSNATFNHPRINRGNHSTLACADCHTIPAATPVFSCTHCHEHTQASMATKHREQPNYQWLSSACYNCHR